MKCEIAGRMRRCTLICDMGYPASERRSMSDRSNLYSSFPMELSIERASGENRQAMLLKYAMSVTYRTWPWLAAVVEGRLCISGVELMRMLFGLVVNITERTYHPTQGR